MAQQLFHSHNPKWTNFGVTSGILYLKEILVPEGFIQCNFQNQNTKRAHIYPGFQKCNKHFIQQKATLASKVEEILKATKLLKTQKMPLHQFCITRNKY